MADFDAAREALVAELEVNGHLTDPLVEEAMLAVPRHLFVPPELAEDAYQDKPLPVGYGQTISAPHMVALMATALQLERGDHVLEVGTGMGYNAAVLASMVGPDGHVTSVEYLANLVAQARDNLAAAQSPVQVEHGDGADGWPAGAPYDAVLVTCAIPAVPQALVDQLKEDGHLVAPVGVTSCVLTVLRKHDGRLMEDDLGPCLFVNAQGRLGHPDPDDLSPTP